MDISRFPRGLKIDYYRLHLMKGSTSLEEIFSGNATITEFKLLKKPIDIRYDSVGEPGYDSYYDEGNMAEGQFVNTIRLKGNIRTSFGGKRNFDVLITCDADDSKHLQEKVELINNRIDRLASYFKQTVDKKS